MRRAGYAAVAAAAVLWAVGGAYASYLIDDGASFVELTQARAWITALVLAGVWLVRRDPRRASAGPPPAWLVVLFGLSIAGANLTYYAAIARLPVAIAITIQYTAPALVVAWAALAERRRPSPTVLAALGAAVAGVALLAELPAIFAGTGSRVDGIGLALAAASAVAYASYMVTGERMSASYDAVSAVLRGFLVAGALWLVVLIARGRPDTLLDPRFTTGIVFLALATTVAPFLLFVWGLHSISASDAGIMSTLEPLAAAFIAFVWLGQVLSGWQIAGGALVVFGIVLVQKERPLPEGVLAERAGVG